MADVTYFIVYNIIFYLQLSNFFFMYHILIIYFIYFTLRELYYIFISKSINIDIMTIFNHY